MNQKQIGAVLLVLAIAVAVLVYMTKAREDAYINSVIAETGSCYLSDGECLHEDRDFTIYIVGWSISLAMAIFAVYLLFLDKTQVILAKHQVDVSTALEEAKRQDRQKDEFNAFLSGFTEEEQKVIKAIKDQDGILQSTLRFRTGMSKTTLSLMLKSLQSKQIITRTPEGKTNKIFLRKTF